MKKLVFLAMLFGAIIITANSVSAQSICSNKSDGRQIYVEIANLTNNAFSVNLVNEKCEETPAVQEVPVMEIFSRILTNGQSFYIRKTGSGEILHQSFVNPAKPILFVETQTDGSKVSVRELDVVGDNDFKMRADAAFAAVKSQPKNVAAGKNCSKNSGGKQVKVKWLNKTNESLLIRCVGGNCEEDKGEELWRNKTFETVSYPGEVFHLYIIIESDQGGLKDYKFITISDSNGTMTLGEQSSSNQNPVSASQGNAETGSISVEDVKKHLIGTWKSKAGESVRYDQNTFTSFDRRGNEGVTSQYRIIDEKTVENAITKDFGFASRSTIAFENNYQTMVVYNSILKETTEYKKVK